MSNRNENLVKIGIATGLFLLALMICLAPRSVRPSSHGETVIVLEWITNALSTDPQHRDLLKSTDGELAIDFELALSRYPDYPLRVEQDGHGYLADAWRRRIRVDSREGGLAVWSMGADGNDSQGKGDDLVAGQGAYPSYGRKLPGGILVFCAVCGLVVVSAIVHLSLVRRSEHRRRIWAIKLTTLFIIIFVLSALVSILLFARVNLTSRFDLAMSIYSTGGSLALATASYFFVDAILLWRSYFASMICLRCGYSLESRDRCPECGLSLT